MALASLDAQLETFAEQADEFSTELQTIDIDDLTRFLVSVFGGEVALWHDWFRHWWTLNPAWNPALPRGWLMRSTAGKLIAFTANIPFSYVVDGTAAICCATGSTAVDPDWRGLGLAKVVGRKFVDQAHGDLLVGTELTDVAYRLWRSLGMEFFEGTLASGQFASSGRRRHIGESSLAKSRLAGLRGACRGDLPGASPRLAGLESAPVQIALHRDGREICGI